MASQADLAEEIGTGRSSRRGPRFLDGDQQQAGQHGNDGDDNQQLNEGEAVTAQPGR
jgi:hypothetical protein